MGTPIHKVVSGLVCTLLFAGSALAQDGTLVAAEFGIPGRRLDVTPQIRSMLHDGILQVYKVLRILYWYQGERRNIVVPEKTVLNLP